MELGGLSFFTSNPILVVTLVMDVGMGAQLARSMLHPYVGNFDIALILEPLTVKDKKEDEPEMMMMAYRKEFNPLREEFRIGKKQDALTYRVDPAKVAFMQRYHRVYVYQVDKSYPVSVGYGMPPRPTSAKGMDVFVARKLWGQAVAATQKMNMTLPTLVAVLCVVAGLGMGFVVFYVAHVQLGFCPIGSLACTVVHTTTATLGSNPP